jgi:UDP-N-acetylglucosamine/UDP-N-acetylgalactosamine diphosphorylase
MADLNQLFMWSNAITIRQPLLDKAVQKLRATYKKFGQDHVFEHYDNGNLNAAQKMELLKDLSKLDLARIASLYKGAMKFDNAGQANLGKLEPLDSYDSIQDATAEQRTQWEKAGYAAIGQGKCAALVLAGGAGTRLGFKFPKGMYNIQLPSNMTLFQLFVERLKKVASNAGGRPIPFYIMTSEGENHMHTVEFFEKNNYFGYGAENVIFFSQGTLPCMTEGGKIMLETGYKVGKAADGNGGIYGALQNTGQVADMKARGIQFVHCFSVDNAIGKVVDPVFMGYCVSRKSDVGNKVVWKAEPGEKVGVLGKRGGKNCVVEYSEMTKEDCALTDAGGKLVYGAGNICNHFYTVDFLSKVSDRDLIFHVARKKIKSPSADGQSAVTPTENTGIKLECFIFDCFGLAKNMAVLEGPRDEEFTPVKNAPGTPKDSPDSARAALTAQNVKWLRAAGAKVVDGPGQCELVPMLTYRGEGLGKFKGQTINLGKDQLLK